MKITRSEHSQSPAAPEALYDAAWRRAALIDIYRTEPNQKKSAESKDQALKLAQRLIALISAAGRLGLARAAADLLHSARYSNLREHGLNLPIYQAIVLAIVQGLGEFIPVSSSGHLIIVRRLMGWNELSPAHELTFDVALHFGTLLAVLVYFRRTWFQIVRAAFGGKVVRFSESGSTDETLTLEETARRTSVAVVPGNRDNSRRHCRKTTGGPGRRLFSRASGSDRECIDCGCLLMWLGERVSTLKKPLNSHLLCRFSDRRSGAGVCTNSRSLTFRIDHYRRPVPQHDAGSGRALQFSALDAHYRWRRAPQGPRTS